MFQFEKAQWVGLLTRGTIYTCKFVLRSIFGDIMYDGRFLWRTCDDNV